MERKSRLITLVGSGGMGKTRLALDFAASAAGRFTPYFVTLAETSNPSQILPAIARTLALPSAPDLVGQLAAFFEGMPRPLLILDNLEQLIAGDDAEAGTKQEGETARIVQSLLLAAPRLSCLCTSRLALGLRGERLLPVFPLALPPESLMDANLSSTLAEYTSVQLYLDRARAVRPDFSLTPENAPSVAAICRLLDGSPLALELAASWVRLLPPRAMWERLTRQSGMTALESRHADTPARHHSLRAALDWSWRLLRPAEQHHLRQVSVFRGGWTADAAETVCREPKSLNLLANLLEASLLHVAEENGVTRYTLLETVRHYAREQLEAADEVDAYRASHAAYFLDRVLGAKLEGPEQTQELDRLEAEHGNLRAALDFCRDDPTSAPIGLMLAAALLPFWRARGYLKEGEERTLEILVQPGASARTVDRAAALNAAGILAMLQSIYDRATGYHEEAREISRELGDTGGEAIALHGLGNVAHFKQDYPAARALMEAALGRRRPGDDKGIAVSWHSLGGLALREGNPAEAVACFERALCLRRRRGDTLGVAGTMGGLAQVMFAEKNYVAAAEYMREALRLFDAAGQRWPVSICLDMLGQIALVRGQREREVRLVAASMSIREKFQFSVPPAERKAKDERIAEMRSLLGTAAFESAWIEGQALTWTQVIAYALSDSDLLPADA